MPAIVTDDNYLPTKDVYGALAACGCICLVWLKKAIHIGVSIDIAIKLRENKLYGKAIGTWSAGNPNTFTPQLLKTI